MDKQDLRNLIMEILQEQEGAEQVRKVTLPALTQSNRLDTGNSAHQVYTRDLFTLAQSPRLGCGLMEMKDTTFDWKLGYDEIDYIIEGSLTVHHNGQSTTAHAGEVILIPKNSNIQFSVQGHALFLYVTYPADWQKA